jgi:hypothetical protein
MKCESFQPSDSQYELTMAEGAGQHTPSLISAERGHQLHSAAAMVLVQVLQFNPHIVAIPKASLYRPTYTLRIPRAYSGQGEHRIQQPRYLCEAQAARDGQRQKDILYCSVI